jgi:hypothetical protein
MDEFAERLRRHLEKAHEDKKNGESFDEHVGPW